MCVCVIVSAGWAVSSGQCVFVLLCRQDGLVPPVNVCVIVFAGWAVSSGQCVFMLLCWQDWLIPPVNVCVVCRIG